MPFPEQPARVDILDLADTASHKATILYPPDPHRVGVAAQLPPRPWDHIAHMGGIDMVGEAAAPSGGSTCAASEISPTALRYLQNTCPTALICEDFDKGSWRSWPEKLRAKNIQALLGSAGTSCIPWTPAGPQKQGRHKRSSDTAPTSHG